MGSGSDKHECCYNGSAWTTTGCNSGGGGSAVVLNLGNNGSTESTGLSAISTNADTNNIATEQSNDSLLFDMSKDWPKADDADQVTCTNCVADSEVVPGLTIDATGAVTWTALTSYPSACSAGDFISAVGDTITCGTPASGTGDVTAVGDCTTGACFSGTAGNTIQLEGATADGFEISITGADPGADFTLTAPAETGTLCSSVSGTTGCGNVRGPASSTTAAIPAWLSTAGRSVVNSQATLTDTDLDASALGDMITAPGGFTSGDRNNFATPVSNKLSLTDNHATLGTTPNCTHDGASGVLTVIDDTNGAGDTWKLCNGTTDAGYFLGYQTIPFSAGSLATDATLCTAPALSTINSGPKLWTVTCADNNGSIVYGDVASPSSYSGGVLVFGIQVVSLNATPSGNVRFDFSCMCRGDGDTINSTWGTAVGTTTAVATQYKEEQAFTADVTCNGSCAGDKSIFWRAVINATDTTATMADVRLLGIQLAYPTSAVSDD